MPQIPWVAELEASAYVVLDEFAALWRARSGTAELSAASAAAAPAAAPAVAGPWNPVGGAHRPGGQHDGSVVAAGAWNEVRSGVLLALLALLARFSPLASCPPTPVAQTFLPPSLTPLVPPAPPPPPRASWYRCLPGARTGWSNGSLGSQVVVMGRGAPDPSPAPRTAALVASLCPGAAALCAAGAGEVWTRPTPPWPLFCRTLPPRPLFAESSLQAFFFCRPLLTTRSQHALVSRQGGGGFCPSELNLPPKTPPPRGTAKEKKREEKKATQTPPRPTEQVIFSALAPRTRIRSHCAPSNARLTVHLGLAVPSPAAGRCELRAGQEARRWATGRALVFDDSFEHEVAPARRACVGDPLGYPLGYLLGEVF